MPKPAIEWTGEDIYARRRELYARAAPVFRRQGYRGTTLKALARACGLSIPALYRYFPSKKAFALFPLAALYPELQGPPPDMGGDPAALLSDWVEAAATEMPNYTLALRLAREVGWSADEQRRVEANLRSHIEQIGAVARRAAPHLGTRAADELASAMISATVGPASTGLEADPVALRRQLRALLRGYGVAVSKTRPTSAAP
ncbi:MAG TPA: TetR/AcrR family transcriptional regulator [Candidatus Limnocylindria bacterium]|nr:TetR/AcrR family transcriptional regulator [Candidatus Limnocylindria bacterium]